MKEREEEACRDLSEIGDASWHMPKQLPLLNIHDLSAREAGRRYRASSARNGRVEDGAVCSLIVSSHLLYS